MDNDTVAKIIMGSFGLVLLALNIIKDMAKPKNPKTNPDAFTTKDAESFFKSIKDNTDALALLIKEHADKAVTVKDAEALLAIKARDQHEAFFSKIPCYGSKRKCSEVQVDALNQAASDLKSVVSYKASEDKERAQYVSDQLAQITTMLSKLYGAKTGRHTEPAIEPKRR